MIRFFALLALVWVAAWLPIGIWAGDPTYVLTPASRDTEARQLYQLLLYGGLALIFFDSWRRSRPARPQWRRWQLLPFYLIQGLLATVVLYGLLMKLGYASWAMSDNTAWQWLLLIGGCVAVAFIEEAVFRGFLLAHFVQRLGWPRGVAIASLIFAAVHLFRPGEASFKVTYGIGLLLLGYLLSCIAWHHNSLPASAGFHAGVIFFNITTDLESFHPSIWSGSQQEPVSGLASWILTVAFLLGWRYLTKWQRPTQ